MKVMLYLIATLATSVFASERSTDAQKRLIDCINATPRNSAKSFATVCKDQWMEALLEDRANETAREYYSGGGG